MFQPASGADSGVFHVLPDSFGSPDTLRDAVQRQLASCPASLLVFHDSELFREVLFATVTPLAKDSQPGPPVFLLLAQGDAAWARALLPSATVLGGQAESPEQQAARKAAEKERLAEAAAEEEAQRRREAVSERCPWIPLQNWLFTPESR